MLPYGIVNTFYQYPFTALAVIYKNQQSVKKTRLTSNIQQNSIAEISKKHFPEKPDIGTVIMVKDHCEANLIGVDIHVLGLFAC